MIEWNNSLRDKTMNKFTKKEHELCDMLAWLSCHADEDCPSEYRSKHFRIALKKAVDYLEDSGWYDFNKAAK